MIDISEIKEATLSEKTAESISAITNYDLKQIPRTNVLGQALSFELAVKPIQKIVEVFKRIPLQNLNELPNDELELVKSTADSFYQIIDQIEDYDSDSLTSATRDQVIDKITTQFQPIFTKLFPVISYLTVRNTDFSELEAKARAATLGAKQEAENAVMAVSELAKDAETAMATIRTTAAEQGVSQQAIHFKTEAEIHNGLADSWAKIMIFAAVSLGLVAVGSLFLHKWNFIAPTNTYETVQLAVSKFLIFGVMSYMLILSARNFMAHKHNQVINKHRQNALVTFTALVEAASIDEKQDIILDRASEAIFGIPDSGFTKSPPKSLSGTNALLRMLPRTSNQTE